MLGERVGVGAIPQGRLRVALGTTDEGDTAESVGLNKVGDHVSHALFVIHNDAGQAWGLRDADMLLYGVNPTSASRPTVGRVSRGLASVIVRLSS